MNFKRKFKMSCLLLSVQHCTYCMCAQSYLENKPSLKIISLSLEFLNQGKHMQLGQVMDQYYSHLQGQILLLAVWVAQLGASYRFHSHTHTHELTYTRTNKHTNRKHKI